MDFPETHTRGRLSIENAEDISRRLKYAAEHDLDLDFGVQIAHDGRVWVCIDSIAWIRFKPSR